MRGAIFSWKHWRKYIAVDRGSLRAIDREKFVPSRHMTHRHRVWRVLRKTRRPMRAAEISEYLYRMDGKKVGNALRHWMRDGDGSEHIKRVSPGVYCVLDAEQ